MKHLNSKEEILSKYDDDEADRRLHDYDQLRKDFLDAANGNLIRMLEMRGLKRSLERREEEIVRLRRKMEWPVWTVSVKGADGEPSLVRAESAEDAILVCGLPDDAEAAVMQLTIQEAF